MTRKCVQMIFAPTRPFVRDSLFLCENTWFDDVFLVVVVAQAFGEWRSDTPTGCVKGATLLVICGLWVNVRHEAIIQPHIFHVEIIYYIE